MATTQRALENIEANLDESIGLRQDSKQPQLSPVARSRDVGRRVLRNGARISVEQVIPDPSQPRREFDEAAIDRLASSIKANGQLSPIRVRWSAAQDKWLIVCGERRWRAIRRAGLDWIECCTVEDDMTDASVLEQQLIENLLREDLTPIEQANGFSSLMSLNGWNGKQVAEALNVPASTVSRALALLDLPAAVQNQVDAGQLAARSAYEISRLDNANLQQRVANQVTNGKLTLQETQQVVRKAARKRDRSRPRKGIKLTFLPENGIVIRVTSDRKVNYHEVMEALEHTIEDVQFRIDSNIST